jgi:hypothetical protein
MAWLHYMLGEHDAMFTWAEAGHEQRSPLMPFLGQLRRFLWREVSDDPRSERMMRRMRLIGSD